MATFKNITNVSMTGATVAISQYTQVLRISGSNGSGNTFTLPQVTASDSAIGYDYEILVIDSASYFTSSTVTTFQVNASDTGYTINGNSSWENGNNNESFYIRYGGNGRWYVLSTGFREGEIINFASGGVLTSISSQIANADDAEYLRTVGTGILGLRLENPLQTTGDPGGYFSQKLTGSPLPESSPSNNGTYYYTINFEATTSGTSFDFELPQISGAESYFGIEVMYVASDGTILSSGGECEIGEWNTSAIASTAVLESFYNYREAQSSSGAVAFLVDWSGSISSYTLTLTCTAASSTHRVTAHIRIYTTNGY